MSEAHPAAPSELQRDIVVVGGSYGSLEALQRVLRAVRTDLPASLFCVQHLAPHARTAVQALQSGSALPTEVARSGGYQRSVAYFAPSDRHLLFNDSKIAVARGPRENNARPSIDVLFRSAAVALGPRVIGVLLSGTQTDGALGLSAIHRCGGVAVVQEPSDAKGPELPAHAIATALVDHRLSAPAIADFLNRTCGSAVQPAGPIPSELRVEARMAAAAMVPLTEVEPPFGQASHLTCPECDGPLWRVEADREHFRCDVGHSFTKQALLAGQSRSLERALWVAFRTLRERAQLLTTMAINARARSFDSSAVSFDERARELEQNPRSIQEVLNAGWSGAPQDVGPAEGHEDAEESDCPP